MSDPIQPTPPSAPIGDPLDRSRQYRAVPPVPQKSPLLPGVAGICIYLLIMAMLNAFASMRGVYGQGRMRVCILIVCTLMIGGVFGMLRMRRWGWAIVTAGALLLSMGDLYFYIHAHVIFYLIRATFGLLFFLYLSRPEVRSQLR